MSAFSVLFFMPRSFKDSALVSRKSGSVSVLALKLVRWTDAKGGYPFSIHLARCKRAPVGVVAGLMEGALSGSGYCVDTMREYGDLGAARNAHQNRQWGGRQQAQLQWWGGSRAKGSGKDQNHNQNQRSQAAGQAEFDWDGWAEKLDAENAHQTAGNDGQQPQEVQV